ncbi:MAG: hypothetical protein DMG66_05110, partial [Acidobacteria bacterium]
MGKEPTSRPRSGGPRQGGAIASAAPAVASAPKASALSANSLPLAVIEFSPQSEIVEWNPAAEKIFGHKRDEAIGHSWDLIVPPRAREQAARAFEQAFAEKKDVQVVLQNSTRSGRVIAGEWSLKPLLDASGQVTGVASLVQDVTEQRAADEALRRSEERYRLLFERNLAAVYWATAEGELVDCNQSFAQMFGFASRSQVMMRHALDIFGQLGNIDVLRERLRQEGSLTNLESLCLRADGTPIWVLQNISLVEDGSGAPMIQGTMIDITERKFAEQNLRQAEGRYRSIFENAAEGIFQTTLDGRWLIVNPKLATILGYPNPAELMRSGKTKSEFYVEMSRRRELVRDIEKRGAIVGLESQIYRRDGQIIWVSESARAVRDEHGHLVGFEGTVQDITERKHAEETLRQNERRLRRQNEMLVELSTRKIVESGDLENALVEITEAAAEILEVEYASVWLLNEDRTILRCVNLFSRSQNSHTRGKEYYVADYPIYMHSLDLERTIDADDAHSDSRTSEFGPSLLEQGVVSMMDSGIRVGGRVVGVLCQEHVGTPRSWTLDEKNFAGSIADLMALALEASDRKRAEVALRESESKFRAVAETAASAIYIHQADKFLFCNRACETISGYKREELFRMDPFALVHPDDRALVQAHFQARMRGAKAPDRYEYR